ncbi:hypothetical protein D4764_04G0016380 [Takifugu flavidus]|uniref:Uncharacterized protein n=1 Tax=Takifugu flavidus TaxID=433684 RepID=A0A5C6N9F0_9TELE|nr:hypothetical protein D4764_04G0016380 [Takifugu flavidus]
MHYCFVCVPDVSGALPLPLKSSPRSACTGPMKTGGGVFVLDHTRWTLPMKDAIDSLLQYHHGDKDILRLVDRDYADMVHRSAADPNSSLRPTTRFHISRYVKHLAKLLNTSSSLNTSPEKLLETQQLWYSLTEGSKTTSVPVVAMETAVVTPPTAALPTPLMQDSIEKVVQGILEMEQQQQRPEQKMRQTKPCLACGQPKSPYGTVDLPSTFSISRVLFATSTAQGRCIRLMLLRDSLTPECPLNNLPRQSFSRGSWRPPKACGGGKSSETDRLCLAS